MHCLTSQGNWELRIDYRLKNGTESYLHYNKFAIGSAKDQYPLNVSGFDNIRVTDPFYDHPLDGMKFASRDQDNSLNGDCAGYGGWWHRGCSLVILNDEYNRIRLYLNSEWHYPTFVEMKIKPQIVSLTNYVTIGSYIIAAYLLPSITYVNMFSYHNTTSTKLMNSY